MESQDRPNSFYSSFYKRPPELLIVEDDPDQSETLCMILEAAGFSVTCTDSGEETVRLLQQRSFDLCLIDWRLPGMPGHQLIGEVKMLDPTCACILLTGHPDPGAAELAVNSGADGFASKPVNPEFLQSLIEGTLFRRILLQEHERFEGVLQTIRTFRHEIGNPLQGLLGNVELMLRRLPSDAVVERYVANIQASADQILALMTRLDELKYLTTRESPVGPLLDLPRVAS